MNRDVLILGLDTFAAKNVAQVRELGAAGYRFDVATADLRGDSTKHFAPLAEAGHRLSVLDKRALPRWRQVAGLVRDGHHQHVELYAGGRFAVAYLAALKRWRRPFCVVERGDIGKLQDYSRLTQASLRLAYRLADGVWYKEPYMATLLRGHGARRLFFIPNAAEACFADRGAPRDLDFLWANRLVVQRQPRWFADALRDPPLQTASAALLGAQPAGLIDHATQANQAYVANLALPNLTIEAFVDPLPYYSRARFFVLPATVVFGNNALLEAMSHGVVPIVTASPGIELLVKDGVNGLVCHYSAEALLAAMRRAHSLDADTWRRLSAAAQDTIASEFSLRRWRTQMIELYEDLAKTSRAERSH